MLPHLQNSGGFFVALFEKNTWLPWQLEARSSKQHSSNDDGNTESAECDEASATTYVKRPDDIIGKYVIVIVCFTHMYTCNLV